MINISQDIYTKLAATSAITALAGSRIWADRNSPPESYRPNDGPAICFAGRGGRVEYDSQVLRVSYKFKCYGETDHASQSPQLSAFNLYAALYDALHDATFGHVRHAECAIQGQPLEEFLLNWPYMLTFFDMAAING